MYINRANSIFDQLDLSLLRHFFAIASFGGFSKASRATGVSQPALSLGLQRLEKSLGFPLVEREKGRFALTPGGLKLFDFCQKLEGGLESMIGSIERNLNSAHSARSRRRLRVGSALSIGFGPLVPACVANGKLEDPFELELVAQNTYQCVSEVSEGGLDAALVPDDVYDARVALTPLIEDQVIFAGNSENRRKFSEWARAVAGASLVTYPRETPMRALVDKVCLREELRFGTIVTTNNVEGLKLLLRSGAGVGFVLRSLVGPELEKREVVEIRCPFALPRTGIVLATRTGSDGEPVRKIVSALLKVPRTSRSPAQPNNPGDGRRRNKSSRSA